ncbi:flagellar protein FlaG [Paenibacillus ginsengihumi]|uniref:flagellar protein FlaG n=1 Tax=Paenibacillus ginsengihumi TaxID=431596 RepID=UPI000374F327|nr:flagellar protein FlaG [Paenibacillus ginsengihumi]
MNTNGPNVNGGGGEWSSQVETSTRSKALAKEFQQSVTLIPPTINNEHQLRRAELQGEHFSISDEQLVKAIERAIKAIQGPYTSLEFSVHEKTKQIMVKVLDKESGDVIREIPPEKNLDLVAKIWDMAGILVDERR